MKNEEQRLNQRKFTFPEIVIGLVGALGAGLNPIEEKIQLILETKFAGVEPPPKFEKIPLIKRLPLTEAGLTKDVLKGIIKAESANNNLPQLLSRRLEKYLSQSKEPLDLPDEPDFRRYVGMLAGDLYRKKVSEKYVKKINTQSSFDSPDKCAMALLSVREIQNYRAPILKVAGKGEEVFLPNTIYILHSLKHPDEVRILRFIYGERFILIGVYKSEEHRRTSLEVDMRRIYGEFTNVDDIVDYFIKRDMKDSQTKYGQNVQDTFPLSDLFLDASSSEDSVAEEIDRFFSLIFSGVNRTPKRHEYAMFHAFAASLLSSAPTRQVGAVIATEGGDIVAVGSNEVAKPGGGQYYEGDSPDKRAITDEVDPNTKKKQEMLNNVFERMMRERLVVKGGSYDAFKRILETSLLNEITEFDKTVHAEMAALLSAARLGISVKGCTLFCTTFPCHLCAKNIIAAGISRLVYINPYPKSKAPDLYPEVFGENVEPRMPVTPFMGIGPRLFMNLFSVYTSSGLEIKRKEDDGRIKKDYDLMLKLTSNHVSQDKLEEHFLDIIEAEED